MRHSMAVPLAFVTVMASTSAFAQATPDAPSPVDREYRHGVEHLIVRGRGAEALEYFHRLWDRTHEPRMLWQMGIAESLLGHWLGAERYMGQVLRFTNDPWVRAQRGGADGLDEDIRRVQSHLGLVVVTCSPACTEVVIGDEPSSARQAYVTPGTVRVTARGQSDAVVTRTVTVAAGATQTVNVVFDVETPHPPSGSPPGTTGELPPSGTPREAEFPRLVFDIGAGVGLALISGRPQYAERFDYARGMTTGYTCSGYICATTVDPGLAPTYFLSANVRVNLSRRLGIATSVRFQFDAADWTVSSTLNDGSSSVPLTRSNPFANLLLGLKLYVALDRDGFARQGLTNSLYLGGGGGQIEPRPGVSSTLARPAAHILSGYGDLHVGYRLEYAWQAGPHFAMEITAHFLFPTFLFDVDFAAMIGFHT